MHEAPMPSRLAKVSAVDPVACEVLDPIDNSKALESEIKSFDIDLIYINVTLILFILM